MKKFWLMKTEPDVFSFEDLVKANDRTTFWEGVRNYQARNFMRDEFKLKDLVLIYHSNTEEPAIMGVAEVVKESYPDAAAMDFKSPYYDEDADKKAKNPWVRVDVKAIQKLKTPVTRDQMKNHAQLKEMMVMQKGSRLSVQPVSEKHFELVCELGKIQNV